MTLVKWKVESGKWKVKTLDSLRGFTTFSLHERGFTKFSLHERGFTLLELLVVVSIIGILAGIALALLNPAVLLGQGKNARRKADLRQIQNALQLYYNDNKAFPNSGNAWIAIPAVLAPNYAKVIPTPPDTSIQTSYEYMEPDTNYSCTDNQAYALKAKLTGTETPTARWCNGTSTINLTDNTYYYLTSD